MDPSFRSWFESNLSNFLGFPAGEEMINYILSYESRREIEEHLSGLLDISDRKTKQFIDEFFKRWTPPTAHEVYKKIDPILSVVRKKTSQAKPAKDTKTTSPGKPRESQGKGGLDPKAISKSIFANDAPKDQQKEFEENRFTSRPNVMMVDTRGAEFLDKNELMPHEKKRSNPFRQKNLKFVPLFSKDGKVKSDVALLPGRHPCQCLGQKHKLVNNCVECGRIVCVQEGAGPCVFCGNLVCSPEDMEIISRDSKKSKKLHEKLISQTADDVEVMEIDDSLQKAVERKNRLLGYDKNSTKRTKVLDDEADYFSSDSRWLSKEQKDALAKRDAELREKRFASRLDKKIMLDFAGRKVVESNVEINNMYNPDDDVVQAVQYGNKENVPMFDSNDSSNHMLDPRLKIAPPIFQCTGGDDTTKNLKAHDKSVRECLRLQDKGIQEMGDKGICLSMHQPWASLLVFGIKKLEGRSWYTAHRGRLWIASTVKVPDKELIASVVGQYQYTARDEDIEFPKTYPTGALLGCVNLVDCAANEEYFENHPDDPEENNSAYLFVCENPEQLSIKLPVKGKHKTYKLDNSVHTAAKNMLMI